MSDRNIERLIEEIARVQGNQLQRVLERIDHLTRNVQDLAIVTLDILKYLRNHRSPPAAGTLRGQFSTGAELMTTAVLTATLPTLRQDGSPLALTDIASITFQKTSLAGSPPVAGLPVALVTNAAATGGLTPAQLTFTDTSVAPGDDYTFYVTDTQGHIGAPSNDVVAPALASPPAAGTLAVTFT